eukprot:9319643-Pyramimonas_sp.AAC.1
MKWNVVDDVFKPESCGHPALIPPGRFTKMVKDVSDLSYYKQQVAWVAESLAKMPSALVNAIIVKEQVCRNVSKIINAGVDASMKLHEPTSQDA